MAKTTKKTVKKKVGKKVGKKAGRTERLAKATKESGKVDLDLLMESINAKLGHRAVERADEANCSYLLRRPTGITSLDIALAGGPPAAATTVITGPDGVGKDVLLGTWAANLQRIYGDDFCMFGYHTEFLMDKVFMKDVCGLQVGMSPDELEELDLALEQAGEDPLTEEQRAHYAHQVGRIYLSAGCTAEEGFDSTLDFVMANQCQLVYVNSIGFLQTEAKEATESLAEFPQQRNEAMLLTKFMPKLAMLLNRVEHGRNETSLVLINQVRSKDAPPRTMPGRVVQEKDKYRSAVGAWALKHGKAIEIQLDKGSDIYDEKTKTYLGRDINWKLTKGKLGTHDGLRGSYKFLHNQGIDLIDDLISASIEHGLIVEYSPGRFYFDADEDVKAHGRPALRKLVSENEEIIEYLQDNVLTAAGVRCRIR